MVAVKVPGQVRLVGIAEVTSQRGPVDWLATICPRGRLVQSARRITHLGLTPT